MQKKIRAARGGAGGGTALDVEKQRLRRGWGRRQQRQRVLEAVFAVNGAAGAGAEHRRVLHHQSSLGVEPQVELHAVIGAETMSIAGIEAGAVAEHAVGDQAHRGRLPWRR